MKVDGMTEISEMLTKLEEKAPAIAAQALYDGAGIMAEEITKGAESIRTAPFKYAKEERRLPSPEEKEIVLQATAGIAKFDKEGTEINTSVGYRNAGYADLKGKTKPIPLIANSINHGTSFMQKQPFLRKAFSQQQGAAVAAIEAGIRAREDELELD